LFLLNYGEVSCLRRSPIEIKPLNHFWPGSFALSVGTLGCNFRCRGCQNWEISRADFEGEHRATDPTSPEELLRIGRRLRCEGLSFTYNEPTVWLEYTLDCFRIAKSQGLYTNYVTNGYMSEEALELLAPLLDSFRVDIKAFREDYYRRICRARGMEGVLRSAVLARTRWGLHVEVITNVIPGHNDGEEAMRDLARWIVQELGRDTPWHLTRFVPHLELAHLPPTPVRTLEKIARIGEEEGLRFVYLGNVPGHEKENTWCPECGALLIERRIYGVIAAYLDENKRCPRCGEAIPITGPVRISGYV
jgi:pyruvate formate lyase activating enzyme